MINWRNFWKIFFFSNSQDVHEINTNKYSEQLRRRTRSCRLPMMLKIVESGEKHQIIRTSGSSKENNNKSGLGFFNFTSFNVFLSFVVHKINIYHSCYCLKLNYIHTWGSFCVILTTLTRHHLSVWRRDWWKMSSFRFYIKHSQSFRSSKHFLVYFHVLWLSVSVINSIIEPFLSFSIINTQFEGFSYSFWLSVYFFLSYTHQFKKT